MALALAEQGGLTCMMSLQCFHAAQQLVEHSSTVFSSSLGLSTTTWRRRCGPISCLAMRWHAWEGHQQLSQRQPGPAM